MMLEVFCDAGHAEELLLMVWTSFNIAVVDLDQAPLTVAENIVRGGPVIKMGYSFRRLHSCQILVTLILCASRCCL